MQDSEAAEIVCMDCGCVVSAKLIDRGPEWRVFGWEQREKRVRVGAPVTFTIHDKGLSTMIDWRDRDVFGKKVSSSKKAQLYRLMTTVKVQTRMEKSQSSNESSWICNGPTGGLKRSLTI